MSNTTPTTAAPAYRSGAVARLTGIPVETLRVWERRYQIVGPRQSASGQRLYSPEAVARLSVIKQLVDAGHAIGSIATLDLETLRTILDQSSRAVVAAQRPAGQGGAPMPLVRVAVIGEALALRVERYRPAALQIVAVSPDVARATSALRGVSTEALLIELPTLHSETARTIRALAKQVGARRVVVEYGLGPARVEQELRSAGYSLARAPVDIAQLESLCAAADLAPITAGIQTAMPKMDTAAPRRFDNRALAEVAMASVALKCECPHHIADLLLRLGNFETYSVECESHSPADAELHRYLTQVAGNARAQLEVALERVAEAEGLTLPTVSS